MAWLPKDPEIEALLSADGPRRYQYFVRQVSASETLWGLYDDGWASLGDDKNRRHLALWPHQLYAEKLAIDAWETYSPAKIPFGQFWEEWLPQLKKDQISLAIFPTPQGEAVVASAETLEADLRGEFPEFFGEDSRGAAASE